MGLSIGQAPVALLAISGPRNVRPTPFLDKADRPAPRIPSRDESSDKPVLFNRPNREPVKIGLGTGVSSSPGAALNVVRDTVREAKVLIPTIAELENGFRRKAARPQRLERSSGRRLLCSRWGIPSRSGPIPRPFLINPRRTA